MSNSQDKSNIAGVIPFYNETETLNKVLKKAESYCDIIIAVDDGSTNNYYGFIQTSGKTYLLKHSRNYGKGAALRTGIGKALQKDVDYIITLDSDGQHDVDIIPNFIQALDEYDVVIGNRMNDISKMPIHRRMSNYLTSYLLSRKLGIKILDSQSGFRAFRSGKIKNILPETNGFEAETEMLIKAAKNNLKIGFVNIPTIYSTEKSKMKSWKTTKNFLKLLFG